MPDPSVDAVGATGNGLGSQSRRLGVQIMLKYLGTFLPAENLFRNY